MALFIPGDAAHQSQASFEEVSSGCPTSFTTLENRLEFTAEELAYIRSDEPLYSDGSISNFLGRLQRQYQKSGSTLEYEQWIRQAYLASGSAAHV